MNKIGINAVAACLDDPSPLPMEQVTANSNVAQQRSKAAMSLQTFTIRELMDMELPVRKNIIAPWLPEKGLAMIVAPRGIGKTFFALSCAYAAACGGSFLQFSVPKPCRTLYIDGEMPAYTMKERMAAIVRGFNSEPPADDYFRILSSDLLEYGIPDLCTEEGQDAVDAQIGDANLVILDNISTLMRSGKENESESWVQVQEWALRHRRRGRTLLFIHHTGRSGNPRGTSKREDVMDTIISLTRPENYTSAEGARFDVDFSKARCFFGDDARPFEAACEMKDNAALWTRKDREDAQLSQVVECLRLGMSMRDIEKETGIKKSTVHRLKEQAVTEGLIIKIKIQSQSEEEAGATL